jgi:hypothetical protein
VKVRELLTSALGRGKKPESTSNRFTAGQRVLGSDCPEEDEKYVIIFANLER